MNDQKETNLSGLLILDASLTNYKTLDQIDLTLEIFEENLFNEGEISTRLGLVGIPSYAEAMIIERDIWLVKDTGCRYHVSHISTKESVDVIRKAKKEGLPITCLSLIHI